MAVAAARAEGYEIVDRNWHCSLGELDVVMKKGEMIVFAEVKTRKDDSYGQAWESVTPAKQARISRIARWYVKVNDLEGLSFRFDVFSVYYKNGRWHYRWFKDAFLGKH